MTTNEIRRFAAESVPSFISIVEGLRPATNAGLWFRGQGNASHRLVPGALRQIKQVTDGMGRDLPPGKTTSLASGGTMIGVSPERMLSEFKRRSRPFANPLPANDFEWMFLAQHHGLPTRLLDWTTNALVALFFACNQAPSQGGDSRQLCDEFLDEENSEFREDGFAVFVIDPGAINDASQGIDEPIDPSANLDRWSGYLDPMSFASSGAALPVCVLGAHISQRMRAQSGTFTLHGSNVWPLDYYTALKPLISKIYVPYTATEAIVRSLSRLGMSRSFIYPGLDSIAGDVAQAEKDKFVASTVRSTP